MLRRSFGFQKVVAQALKVIRWKLKSISYLMQQIEEATEEMSYELSSCFDLDTEVSISDSNAIAT